MNMPYLKGSEPAEVCGRDHTADWEAIFQAAQQADSLARARADSVAWLDSLATHGEPGKVGPPAPGATPPPPAAPAPFIGPPRPPSGVGR
jgi:hypothetical protein